MAKPFTRADFAGTFGWRNPEIIRKLFDPHGGDEYVAELGARKEEYYRAAARAEGISLLPGARPLLEGLYALGVAQAVGSSAPRANVELILELTRTRMKRCAAVPSGAFSRTTIVSVFDPVRLTSVVSGVFGLLLVAA